MNKEDLQAISELLDAKLEPIIKKLNSITEQTANLTEFKNSVTNKLDVMSKTLSRIEIATADNWSDIAKLKAIK
jgi:hypothetical protein